MNPLVSIIIPCYNGEAYVAEAIESSLRQEYKQREVIVVDDGSTDNSMEVVRSFGSQIRWETGPNRGGCAARNRGLSLARGSMVQFLDADDLLHPEKLVIQVPLLQGGGSEVVYCDVDVVDADSNERIDTYKPYQSDSFARCCLDTIQTAAPLHWKTNVQSVDGFDESLPCAQERDLHLRMACCGMQFQHHSDTLVTVRRRTGSVSSDYRRVLCVRRRIVEQAAVLLEERGLLTDQKLRYLAGMLARDARALLQWGHQDEADRSFETARRIHPDGGLDVAYTQGARLVQWLVGPLWAESLIRWKRRLVQNAVARRSHE